MEEFALDRERRERRAEEVLERRKFTRYAVDGVAEVLLADGRMLFHGRVLDISVAGCYVETRARLRMEPGTLVEMVFRVGDVIFRVEATSRMVRPGEGAGFLFGELSPRMRVGLEGLIRELGG